MPKCDFRTGYCSTSTFEIRHLNFPEPTIGKTVDDAMVAIERDWRMSNAEVRMWN